MFKPGLYSAWQAIVSFALLMLLAPLAAAAPQITRFEVDQVNALTPGTEVDFSLTGTPRARASVRIAGIPRTIVLKETGRGFYEGTYIVRKKDRISSRAGAAATLSQGNNHATARLKTSLVATATPLPAGGVLIERFTADPIESLEPGTELIFTLNGTPNGRAFFTIENMVTNRRMQEVNPGVYKGRYTIRRQDNFPSAPQISASLQANGRITRAQLDQRIVSDVPPVNAPPVIVNVSPRHNETVPYSNNFAVSGTFDDERRRGIDARSVQIIFDGRDVTSQSSITSQNFSYRPTGLTAGNHTVEVRARDRDGNISRTNWNFRMLDAAPVAGFPLDILLPHDGAEIGSGVTEVRGRTLANASVQVLVTAGIFGLTQRIYEDTVVADSQGYFRFSFQPQVRVPGARYEVSVRATRDNEMRERKIALIQQR